MAELDTLKSYLISLGFAVDIASYRKMNQLLDQQKKMVMNSTGVMSNSYVKAGKTIAGVLVAVGAATVTLMDKVAKADLGYDLFGMKMYMTADAAKKVKIAVDALGYSMDEIAWNPELKKRFDQLIELQGGLQKKLGPDYKQAMREIRDIRFEFTKMRVEGEYMMQIFVYELFKRLGISAKDVHELLKRFNDWLMANMVPAMKKLADVLARTFEIIKTEGIPIFNTLWDSLQMILPSIGYLIRDLIKVGQSFGAATGDAKKFIEQMAVGDDQVKFLDWLGSVSYVMSGLTNAAIFLVRSVILLGRAMHAAGSGNLKDIPGIWKDAVDAWKNYNEAIDLEKRGTERLQRSGDKARTDGAALLKRNSTVSPGVSRFKDLLSQYFPGQEHVAAAIMKAESGGDPNAHNRAGGGTGAFGLFQIRGTLHEQALKKAGIIKQQSDLFDPEKNFQAAKFLYDRGGWQPWNASRRNWEGALSSNTTNNVTVNVTQPGATADQIAEVTTRKMEDLDRRRRAREIRELAGVMG